MTRTPVLALIGASLFALIFALNGIAAARPTGDAPKLETPKPFPIEAKEIPIEGADGESAFIEIDRGVPVAHLFGDPRERGRQHGALLAPQIRCLIDDYVRLYIPKEKDETTMPVIFGLEAKIPRRFREEMRGVSEGSGIDYNEILLANCFVDLSGIGGCSVAAVEARRSKTGKLLMARNLDWPGHGIIHQADVLFVHHPPAGSDGDDSPKNRRALASVGWPGLVGVVSGMNEDGLAAAMLVEMTQGPRLVGAPNIIAYRQLLEEASTVDEAEPFFELHPIIASNNLALADAGNPGENRALGSSLVMELDPYWGYAPRTAVEGALTCTNWFVNEDKAGGYEDGRRARLESALSAKPKHGFLDLRRYLQKTVMQGQTDIQNLQAMIFEPESKTIYLSVEELPAANGKFLRFDVQRLVETKPKKSDASSDSEE